MELLRLFTCTISTKWPEVEAWKVMTQLQEIYQPNDVQSIAEVRYKLGDLKMGADQNPSILFFQLATLEHAYFHTKGRKTHDDLIWNHICHSSGKILPNTELGDREPRSQTFAKHLEMAMREIWHQNGGKEGIRC